MTTCIDKLKQFAKERLQEREDALVVGWFDVGKLLFFVMIAFVALGPLVDQAWLYEHNTKNNSNTSGWYSDADTQTVDSLYEAYRFIPIAAIVIVFFFIINYSGMKKNE